MSSPFYEQTLAATGQVLRNARAARQEAEQLTLEARAQFARAAQQCREAMIMANEAQTYLASTKRTG